VGALTSTADGFDPRLRDLGTVAPKVSIIVTNYNYSRYICDSLRSVSAQDYHAIECVVVDDGSVDDSVEKIRRFIENDTSNVLFKLIAHESTRGQYAAFRTGLEQTSGAFVSFLDADDLLLPDFVSEHVRIHLSKPPVAFTSSNQYQIDSSGQLIGGVHPDLHVHDRYRTASTVSLHQAFWIWATTSSMMFRRSVLGCVLSDADDSFRRCADNYICHFCNMLGGSILIPGVFGCYRRHGGNTFSTNPLIGGRLPTGDMRNHPGHEAVIRHIRERLFERSEQFIALLGIEGFLHAIIKVTTLPDLRRNLKALHGTVGLDGVLYRRFFLLLFWFHLRRMARVLRNRHPCVSIGDLDAVTPTETSPCKPHRPSA
jgi:glycosyltransferase involved in cell wall biosynthesis